jgi:ankyrin repeat protein
MGRHEIFDAIQAGDLDRVGQLAEAAPELNEDGVSALIVAKYYGRDDMVEILRPEKPQLDAFEAAALGETERLRELLDFDPSLVGAYAPDGFTLLGLAAFFKHPEAVRLLLERGADPNQQARHAEIKAYPIHSAAAEGGSTEIVRLLLDAGADVNVEQPGGFTALDAAEQAGNTELIALLRERGAS